MKTLIALRGAGNRGKSTTLKAVIELVKAAYPSATFEETRYTVDVTIVIVIGRIKVGIETQGDPNSRLGQSLKIFIEVGCKVIVCASRSYGRTVVIVTETNASGYQINWVKKASVEESARQAAANKVVAKEIFAMVQAAIDTRFQA